MPLTVAEVSADALGSAFVDHFGTDHPPWPPHAARPHGPAAEGRRRSDGVPDPAR
ncbi:hypothetical protein [Embleya sp. NPDC020886]|uniref:hypothetical protein n=1 Tax=Embleya sp. NPDC020886 TaxID=3363980 RepID=UPI00379A01B0